MKLKNVLLLVEDLERSRNFYTKLFGLFVVRDFDTKLILSEGLVLQERGAFDAVQDVLSAGTSFVLYFECFDIEEFILKLDKFESKIRYLHGLKDEYEQKLIRIYDPDSNLIEVREVNCKGDKNIYEEDN